MRHGEAELCERLVGEFIARLVGELIARLVGEFVVCWVGELIGRWIGEDVDDDEDWKEYKHLERHQIDSNLKNISVV